MERFCPACGEVTPQDSLGCVQCRHRAAVRSDAITKRNRRVAWALLAVVVISLASWRVASSIEGEAASRPEPLPAAQPVTRPMRITATGDAEIAARALIAWCGYDGNTALWRAGLDVEVVDIGGGRFNIGINHDEKTRLLDGNVLWYMAELRKGKLYAVTPSKRASAQACRALDETPMADGLRVIVR